MLPKPKAIKKAPEKETLKPSAKSETFSTDNPSVVADLTAKGFHVEAQIVIGDRMVYTFAEPKSEIEKAK